MVKHEFATQFPFLADEACKDVLVTSLSLNGDLFGMGRIALNTSARDKLNAFDLLEALHNHGSGNWGNIDQDRREKNQRALRKVGSIVSVFRTATGESFAIHTMLDRSNTLVWMYD